MARSRYNLIPAPIWPYLGPAFKGIDQDLSALESSGGGGTGGGVKSWNDLTDKPNLAPVATSGSYTDLTNKPTPPNLAPVATSGSYDDLTNKPTIPDDVTPYLPPMRLPARGTIRTVNRVNVNTSTQFPDPVSWTEDSLLKIVIQNPADAGQNLNLGYGLYGNPNNQGLPNVVQPGKEWVGSASSLPIFGRMDTNTQATLVISERSA